MACRKKILNRKAQAQNHSPQSSAQISSIVKELKIIDPCDSLNSVEEVSTDEDGYCGNENGRVACWICGDYLFPIPKWILKLESPVANIFGHAYGPLDNPFLLQKQAKEAGRKLELDPAGLQATAMKCGHVFHKGCIKRMQTRTNGGYVTTGECPIPTCKQPFTLSNILPLHWKNITMFMSENETKSRIKNAYKVLKGLGESKEAGQKKERKYFNKINKSRSEMIQIAGQILKTIRHFRKDKREIQKIEVSLIHKLEEQLVTEEDETLMWKSLLGQRLLLDDNALVSMSTPGGNSVAPTSKISSHVVNLPELICHGSSGDVGFCKVVELHEDIKSSNAKQEIRDGGAEADYTEIWEQVAHGETSIGRPPTQLLPNGLYEEFPEQRESDDEYDLTKMLQNLRVRIKKEVDQNRKYRKNTGLPNIHNQQASNGDDGYEETEIPSDYLLEKGNICKQLSGSGDDVRKEICDDKTVIVKLKRMLSTLLKFDYKAQHRLLDWENDFGDLNIKDAIPDFLYTSDEENTLGENSGDKELDEDAIEAGFQLPDKESSNAQTAVRDGSNRNQKVKTNKTKVHKFVRKPIKTRNQKFFFANTSLQKHSKPSPKQKAYKQVFNKDPHAKVCKLRVHQKLFQTCDENQFQLSQWQA